MNKTNNRSSGANAQYNASVNVNVNVNANVNVIGGVGVSVGVGVGAVEATQKTAALSSRLSGAFYEQASSPASPPSAITNVRKLKNERSSYPKKMVSRRNFSIQFKLDVLEAYRSDPKCKSNQRATARKFNIHRRQIQKWLQCETSLRSSVVNARKCTHERPQQQQHQQHQQQQAITTNMQAFLPGEDRYFGHQHAHPHPHQRLQFHAQPQPQSHPQSHPHNHIHQSKTATSSMAAAASVTTSGGDFEQAPAHKSEPLKLAPLNMPQIPVPITPHHHHHVLPHHYIYPFATPNHHHQHHHHPTTTGMFMYPPTFNAANMSQHLLHPYATFMKTALPPYATELPLPLSLPLPFQTQAHANEENLATAARTLNTLKLEPFNVKIEPQSPTARAISISSPLKEELVEQEQQEQEEEEHAIDLRTSKRKHDATTTTTAASTDEITTNGNAAPMANAQPAPAPAPAPKRRKLFKPYLLDGNSTSDDEDEENASKNSSVEKFHTETLKELQQQQQQLQQQQQQQRQQQQCQNKSIAAALLSPCSAPALSPNGFICSKGSPVSGYESSSSTCSETLPVPLPLPMPLAAVPPPPPPSTYAALKLCPINF